MQALRAQARLFSNRDHVRALSAGDVWAVVGWSTDLVPVAERTPSVGGWAVFAQSAGGAAGVGVLGRQGLSQGVRRAQGLYDRMVAAARRLPQLLRPVAYARKPLPSPQPIPCLLRGEGMTTGLVACAAAVRPTDRSTLRHVRPGVLCTTHWCSSPALRTAMQCMLLADVMAPASGTSLWADVWVVPAHAKGGHMMSGPSPILPSWLEFCVMPGRISTLPGFR